MARGKRLIGQGWWTPPPATLDPETGQGNPYFVYTYSTHMAEVVVDMETGEVEVTGLCGRLRHRQGHQPQAVEGQIEGGVAMGLGYALMEEIVLKDGVIQNLSLQNYLIPTSLDVPGDQIDHPGDANDHGPYGAKGIGEMPNIPATPAILNAIANACGGTGAFPAGRPGKSLLGDQGSGRSPGQLIRRLQICLLPFMQENNCLII